MGRLHLPFRWRRSGGGELQRELLPLEDGAGRKLEGITKNGARPRRELKKRPGGCMLSVGIGQVRNWKTVGESEESRKVGTGGVIDHVTTEYWRK